MRTSSFADAHRRTLRYLLQRRRVEAFSRASTWPGAPSRILAGLTALADLLEKARVDLVGRFDRIGEMRAVAMLVPDIAGHVTQGIE